MGIMYINTSSVKAEFGYSEKPEAHFTGTQSSGHEADRLIYSIKKYFDESEISLKSIDFVSLSNGPGSFTGLRIGSALAKGICYANRCRLLEIPTLDLIANKHKSGRKVVPLIQFNSRSPEFYFCEYEFDRSKLVRLNGYRTGILKDILDLNAEFLINENGQNNIPAEFRTRLREVSELSNIESMAELTFDLIKENKFADYKTSEPYYMKEFVPKHIRPKRYTLKS